MTRAWLRSLPFGTPEVPDADLPHADSVPDEVFLRWLAAAVAAGAPDPQVCVLSTVRVRPRPVDAHAIDGGASQVADLAGPGGSVAADARVVTVRDVGTGSWWFSGPGRSPKAVQLQEFPSAALTFYWAVHGRQVRVRGPVALDSDSAATDFLDRSETARRVAAGSRQSAVLDDPDDYAAAVAAADPNVVPPDWGTWRLRATEVEFWQANPGARHQRWLFTRSAQRWDLAVLWP